MYGAGIYDVRLERQLSYRQIISLCRNAKRVTIYGTNGRRSQSKIGVINQVVSKANYDVRMKLQKESVCKSPCVTCYR